MTIPTNIIDEFIEAAIGKRLGKAKSLLATHPNLSEQSIAAAAVAGNVDALRRFLAADPNAANDPCGPRNRPPLLYTTFSWLVKEAAFRDGLIDSVRILLQSGADVNAAYREEPFMSWPLPALYGATGLLNEPDMAHVLIEAGADVNGDEPLYHSLEHRDHECLQLLLNNGAIPHGNTLHHALDYEDSYALQLLLSHGADPKVKRNGNLESALVWAIERGRSLEIIALLVENGAEIDATAPNQMTALRTAMRCGRGDIVEYLVDRCAIDDHQIGDDYIYAALSGDKKTVDQIRLSDPLVASKAAEESGLVFTRAASTGNVTTVLNLINAGFPINVRGEANATPLHIASWNARVDIVAALLDHGADTGARGTDYGDGNPLQWAFHGSGNNTDANSADFFAVIDKLVSAGSAYDPAWLDVASDDIRDQFRDLPARS